MTLRSTFLPALAVLAFAVQSPPAEAQPTTPVLGQEFEGLGDESAGNLGWEFLERLRASGRGALQSWLDETPRGGGAEI